MKQDEPKKARELLDQAWKATPPAERSRALILNRAIVDLSDRLFVMRAVRDLSDYLIAHKQRADEPATDILAAALNNSAAESMRKRGQLWQSAYKEWERRNDLLDQSRPGFHRWGTDWLTDEEYAQLHARQKDLEQAIRAQVKRTDAAERRLGAINQQSTWEFIDQAGRYFPTNSQAVNQAADFEAYREWLQNQNHNLEIYRNSSAAYAELREEWRALSDLIAQRERPKWPMQFDPIEP